MAGRDPLQFADFLLRCGALHFGRFTLKSGRESPYFFNSASFNTGASLARLGEFYAGAVMASAPGTQVVFGPAYKGIPLAIATATAMSALGPETGYLFNRKEAKTHGDAGLWVGQSPKKGQPVAMVDDVITDGATKYEAVEMLTAAFECSVATLVIAFNRMETDSLGQDALAAFTNRTGIPVVSLLTLAELQGALEEGLNLPSGAPALDVVRKELAAYRQQYGLPESG